MAGSKQASFTLGEVAPSLHGKADSDLYTKALRKCRNFIIHPQGGASNRPGTEFVGNIDAQITNIPPRLIPFHFSTYENYMLVFTEAEIRIVKDGAFLESNGQEIVVASPYMWEEIWAIDYAQSGDVLFMTHGNHPPQRLIRNSEADWELEDIEFKNGPYAPYDPAYANVTLRITLTDGGYADVYCYDPYHLFSSGMVGYPIAIGTENYDDPSDVTWGYGTVSHYYDSQHILIHIKELFWEDYVLNPSFDVDLNAWRIAHEDPGSVEWQSNGSARFEGQWGEIQQSIEGLAPATDYRVSYTAYFQSTVSNAGPIFQIKDSSTHRSWDPTDIFSIIAEHRIKYSDIWELGVFQESFTFRTPDDVSEIWLAIHADCFLSGIPVNDDLIFNLKDINITVDGFSTSHFRLPAFSPGASGQTSYPKHIEFYEQRLCLANTDNYPQTVWMSRTGGFYDFSFHTPYQDDDSICYQLASRRIDPITWLEAANELIIGTASTIWRMSAGSNTQVITPYSVTCRIQAADGCAEIRPLNVLGRVLYLQRGFRSVRDLGYSFEQDKFLGFDLTYGAKHLLESRSIRSWDYEAVEKSIVWCVLEEGLLAGITYFPEQEIYAWHVHRFKNGAFMDVAVLHNYYGDEVYLVTWRAVTINGVSSNRYYVERMKPRIDFGVYNHINAEKRDRVLEEKTRLQNEGNTFPNLGIYKYNYWFLDCAIRVVHDTPGYEITGLEHLAGRGVDVLADGALYKDITVPDSGTISVDHAFSHAIVGQPYHGELVTLPINARMSGNRRMVINEARIKFERTRSAYVSGGDDNAMEEEVKFRDVHDGDDPIELRTGIYSVPIPAGWGDDCCVKVISRDPVPTTVLSIDLEVEAGDR